MWYDGAHASTTLCPPSDGWPPTTLTWAIAFADEVWWSRLAQPEQHGWVADDDLLRLAELERAKDDRDPKALACYGCWCAALPMATRYCCAS